MIYKYNLADIVDLDNQLRYISDGLLELFGVEEQKLNGSISIDDFKLYSNGDASSSSSLKRLNQRVVEKNRPIKFISTGLVASDEYCVFRESKYPVCDSHGSVVGVFTLLNLATAIHIEPNQPPLQKKIVFSLDNDKLNDLDELILFYSSIGFTQSEIYQSVVNLGYEFTMNGFKYHYNQLLVRNNAISVGDMLANIEMLRNKRFIPRMLIESNAQYILL